MCWGGSKLIFSIGWTEPLADWDSGFTVLFDDAPDPDELGPDPTKHPGIRLVHLGCLLEDHPEIGVGLDIARKHRVVDLDDAGRWVAGDVSRPEIETGLSSADP
ncbi:MAG TPA: hypothetical protein VH816_15630 [Gaiellaceae bacterium]|jgi:hypothetical protein